MKKKWGEGSQLALEYGFVCKDELYQFDGLIKVHEGQSMVGAKLSIHWIICFYSTHTNLFVYQQLSKA